MVRLRLTLFHPKSLKPELFIGLRNHRLFVRSIHQNWRIWMVSRVNHIVHNLPTALRFLINWIRDSRSIAQLFFEPFDKGQSTGGGSISSTSALRNERRWSMAGRDRYHSQPRRHAVPGRYWNRIPQAQKTFVATRVQAAAPLAMDLVDPSTSITVIAV